MTTDLVAHARQRQGWESLSPTMRERIERVLEQTEAPDLGIIAADNQALRERLDYSADQWKRIATAMKQARLLDVRRRWTTDPVTGQSREAGPATWLYASDDAPRRSQVSRQRRSQAEVKIRQLESDNAVLRDELRRVQGALLRTQEQLADVQAAISEHVPETALQSPPIYPPINGLADRRGRQGGISKGVVGGCSPPPPLPPSSDIQW